MKVFSNWEKKILLNSKDKIEKSILEYKKNPKFNHLNLFSNSNKENKNELNENVQNDLNNICKIENIEDYLKGNNISSNPITNILSDFIKN